MRFGVPLETGRTLRPANPLEVTMSIRCRNLLVLLSVLCLAAVASACDHKPTENNDNQEYCDQNPHNCAVPEASR